MNRVAVIDCGISNVDSVCRAIEKVGGVPIQTTVGEEIASASRIILPGVGAFPEAMERIRQLQIDKILNNLVVDQKTPFLGICLGMQLLATRGFEDGETAGLGFIRGEVRRGEPAGRHERSVHIGWNEVHYAARSPLFEDVSEDKDFYFVHRYCFCLEDRREAIALTPYFGGFVSALGRGNIFGVQFHPEKSQKAGLQILRNFMKMEKRDFA